MSRRLLAAVLLLAVACSRATMTGGAPENAPLTDGNIIAIILAANNTDLSYARLAPSRAASDGVKAFAQRMTTDHTLLNNRANEIATKDGIVAADNEISLDFRDKSAARRDILRELEGRKFDSTYAANEVQYHTELLAALNGALVPSARNAELREFTQQLVPAVSAHLSHAEMLYANFTAKK